MSKAVQCLTKYYLGSTSCAAMFCAFLLSSGCGFTPLRAIPAIHVPYITKDTSGVFTQALCQEVALHGGTVSEDARYTLKAKLFLVSKNITAYQYTQSLDSEEYGNRLGPVQATKKVVVEIELYDNKKKKIVIPATLLQVEQRYDFSNANSQRDIAEPISLTEATPILELSLGRLDSMSGADSAAEDSIAVAVAKKILNHIAPHLQNT